jgi:hypothetical protein
MCCLTPMAPAVDNPTGDDDYDDTNDTDDDATTESSGPVDDGGASFEARIAAGLWRTAAPRCAFLECRSIADMINNLRDDIARYRGLRAAGWTLACPVENGIAILERDHVPDGEAEL